MTPSSTPEPTPSLTPSGTPEPTPTVTPTQTEITNNIVASNEGTHYPLLYRYGQNNPQKIVSNESSSGKKISRNVKDLRRRNFG